MDTFIGNRLRAFRQRTKIKMPEIAKFTGIPKDNLYKWERGHKPSDIKEYNKLNDYLDAMEGVRGYVLKEPVTQYKKGLNRRTASVLVSIFFGSQEEPEIYAGGRAKAGTITEVREKPVLIAYENDSIHFGKADGLIYVPDKAMEPRIESGALVTIGRLQSEGVRAGNCYYLIDNYNQVLLRKLYPLKDKKIRLQSENEKEFPELILDWRDIKAVFWVGKVIKDP